MASTMGHDSRATRWSLRALVAAIVASRLRPRADGSAGAPRPMRRDDCVKAGSLCFLLDKACACSSTAKRTSARSASDVASRAGRQT